MCPVTTESNDVTPSEDQPDGRPEPSGSTVAAERTEPVSQPDAADATDQPAADETGDSTPVVHRADGDVGPAPAEDEDTVPADEVRRPLRQHEHPTPRRPHVRVQLPATLALLLGIAGAVIAIGGLQRVSSIIAPTFLALTLVIAIYPLHKAIKRFLPGGLGALLTVLLLYGILFGLSAGIGVAAGKFATEVAKPEYSDTFATIVEDGRRMLVERGISEQQIDDFIKNFDLKSLSGVAKTVANTLTGLTTTMLFLLTVIIFLAMDAGGFPRRLTAIHRYKPDVADALVDFGLRVRKYWIVSTIFGLIVAVIDYVALLALGVPLAATFGLLAFITNYIPNIGFVLGLVPPALIALLDGGVTTMIWVVVIYSVVNFVIQTILQPRFTGDAVGINATTAFLSLVFWAYVFGPLGALLAIPFTLLVKSLLIDRDPDARWVNQFIASDPVEDKSAQPI